MRPFYRLALATLVAALAFHIDQPAYAYLDPGTGSMILQLILGGTAGLLIVGKLYWHRLKEFFGISSAEATANEKTADPDAD
jgi:hypothetical protein